MRAPSLYSCFGSKDTIYDAMFAESQHRLAEVLSELSEEGLTRADLHRGARVFFDFCTADGLTAHQISNDPGGERWSDLLPETIDLFCDHVGVPR